VGLDQFAYAAAKADTDWDSGNRQEIAYWRKHPNLQGWMEQLWRSRNTDPSVDPTFNGVELELIWEDLDLLEEDVKNGRLPATRGFFFGDGSDEYYRETDLKFIKEARAEIFTGLKVFYNSSW
jgi:hypothetical protein